MFKRFIGGTLVKEKGEGSFRGGGEDCRSQCNVEKRKEEDSTLEESLTAAVIRKLGMAS